MTAAPTLFDFVDAPLPARRGEPTSRQAARRLNLRSRKAAVMEAVRLIRRGGPGSFTADEVRDVLLRREVVWAEQVGSVRSRMSQLAHDGLIVRCGVAEGRCGSSVMTWMLTAEGAAYLACEGQP